MTEILQFDIEDVGVVDEQEDSQFATLKIDAFASGPNKHGLIISEETLKKTASTILQKPIVWLFDKVRQDATTHSDLESAVGFIPHDSPIEYRTLSDGRVMMTISGRVWKRYSGKMVDIFKRDGKKKSVSVEMEVLDIVRDIKTGFTEILDFVYLCITILGEGVKPAIPLAHAEMVAFATKEKQEYQKALLEFSSRYSGVDLTIPLEIKKNAEKGLKLNKEHNLGATSVSLATARFIGKNETISPEKVRHIYKYLNSHKSKPMNKKLPDGAYISFLMHGGNDAYEWSKNLVEKLEEADNKKTSYFGETHIEDGMIEKQSIKNMGELSPKEELSVNDEKDVEKKEEMAAEEPKDENKEEEKVEVKEEMAAEESKDEEKEEQEEEKSEEEQEEKDEEPKTEKMSLDSNLDMAALLAMLADETEGYKELVASHSAGTMDYSVLCSAMFAKMCSMAEEMKSKTDAYMSENQALKEFKTDVESKQFAFEVEATLSDVSKTMPKDEIEKAREDSANFSIDTIDAWKNKTKAIAFGFVDDKKVEDKPKKVGLPFMKSNTAVSSSPWKR